jgi:hypothetical protein
VAGKKSRETLKSSLPFNALFNNSQKSLRFHRSVSFLAWPTELSDELSKSPAN